MIGNQAAGKKATAILTFQTVSKAKDSTQSSEEGFEKSKNPKPKRDTTMWPHKDSEKLIAVHYADSNYVIHLINRLVILSRFLPGVIRLFVPPRRTLPI